MVPLLLLPLSDGSENSWADLHGAWHCYAEPHIEGHVGWLFAAVDFAVEEFVAVAAVLIVNFFVAANIEVLVVPVLEVTFAQLKDHCGQGGCSVPGGRCRPVNDRRQGRAVSNNNKR